MRESLLYDGRRVEYIVHWILAHVGRMFLVVRFQFDQMKTSQLHCCFKQHMLLVAEQVYPDLCELYAVN